MNSSSPPESLVFSSGSEVFVESAEQSQRDTREDLLEGVTLNSVSIPGSSAESSLDTSLLLLNRVVHAAVTSIVVTDPHQKDNPIVFHNPAFEAISGYEAGEIDGHNCRFLQGLDTDPAAVQVLREAIEQEQFCHITILNYRKDGTPFWNELALSPVHDANGNLTNFVGVQNDVTRRADAERERDLLLEQQKSIVDTLHKALLLTSPPAYESLEVATQFHPVIVETLLGGDFYDVFSLDEHNVVLVCGDVTGKGLKAARYTAEIKYGLRILLREHPQQLAQAMGRMNGFLLNSLRLDDRDQDSLVCVTVAVVNTLTGRIETALSGMEAPLILRADGREERLEALGPILGMDTNSQYTTVESLLGIGDVLLMTTDGITEIRSREGEFFGEGPLLAAARDALKAEEGGKDVTSPLPLESAGAAIIDAAKAFTPGKPKDDICLMLARRSAASFSSQNRQAWGDQPDQFSIETELAALLPTLMDVPSNSPSENTLETERQAITAATRQEREILRLALEAGRLGLFRRDLATGAVDGTTQLRINLGMPPDAVLNYDRLLEIVHPEDRDLVESRVAQAVKQRSDYYAQYRIRTPSGELRWIEARGRAIYAPDGTPIQIIGVTHDVTELRRTEQALQSSETARHESARQLQVGIDQQRRFVREMLASVTEGRLRLCDSETDLPPLLTAVSEPLPLTALSLQHLRQVVKDAALDLGFSSERIHDLLTAVGEAGMNAVKHGGGGEGLVFVDTDRALAQVVIKDTGTGIRDEDLHRATLEKGWSSANTLGHGFYLMLRCADRTYLLTNFLGTTVVLEQEAVQPLPSWLSL